eukprot:8329523-Pyramimonas_sp.AAC.1
MCKVRTCSSGKRSEAFHGSDASAVASSVDIVRSDFAGMSTTCQLNGMPWATVGSLTCASNLPQSEPGLDTK